MLSILSSSSARHRDEEDNRSVSSIASESSEYTTASEGSDDDDFWGFNEDGSATTTTEWDPQTIGPRPPAAVWHLTPPPSDNEDEWPDDEFASEDGDGDVGPEGGLQEDLAHLTIMAYTAQNARCGGRFSSSLKPSTPPNSDIPPDHTAKSKKVATTVRKFCPSKGMKCKLCNPKSH